MVQMWRILFKWNVYKVERLSFGVVSVRHYVCTSESELIYDDFYLYIVYSENTDLSDLLWPAVLFLFAHNAMFQCLM